jgi:hypothetical protein
MSDYLVSWKDGKAKQAIVDFIDTVTTNGSSFVEPSDRIATFDNDGTFVGRATNASTVQFLIPNMGKRGTR